MITRITGKLVQLGAQAAIIATGPFEYEVLVPEFVRRQLQASLGSEVSLKTIEYIEGNAAQGGKLVPRIIGFMSDAEREFFDAICSVDGVGVKKALRAMVQPVSEVAIAIEEQDAKTLSALPGVGAALAERIIAKLRRKAPKFALMVAREQPAAAQVERSVVDETYEVLRSLGHSESEARRLLDAALKAKKKYPDVETLLQAVYQTRHAE